MQSHEIHIWTRSSSSNWRAKCLGRKVRLERHSGVKYGKVLCHPEFYFILQANLRTSERIKIRDGSYCCCWCCCKVASVVSDSVRPHRWQPRRRPCACVSPGKNTGVGCHFPLQCRKVKIESEVAQSCPTLSDPMGCSLPDSSVHGIFQARLLEWVATAFSILAMCPWIN